MMKKMAILAAGLACLVLVSGCYMTPYPAGILYTDTKGPVTATSQEGGAKVGEAVSRSFLGLIALGDSSIQAAMKNGGLTRVSHVDVRVHSVLGVFASYTTIVYGE